MQYIPPELRQGLDEIDLARGGTIPDLVELGDLRGDFHMHSTWSDGDDSLEEMIAAAAARGYEYHAISDHSQGRGSTLRPRSPESCASSARRSPRSGERYGIRTLCASEVDILPDGSLDFRRTTFWPSSTSSIGSVHSRVPANARRDDRAPDSRVRKPVRHVIGHPTGRVDDAGLRIRLRRRLCRGGANRHRAGDRRTEDSAGSARAAGAARERLRRNLHASIPTRIEPAI